MDFAYVSLINELPKIKQCVACPESGLMKMFAASKTTEQSERQRRDSKTHSLTLGALIFIMPPRVCVARPSKTQGVLPDFGKLLFCIA